MKIFNSIVTLVIFASFSLFTSNTAKAQEEKLAFILEGDSFSFQSMNYPDKYLTPINGVLELVTPSSDNQKKSTVFKVVKGLWGTDTYSLESVEQPGYYLRHQNFVLKLHKATPDELFKKDASFKTWQSNGDENMVSFESINYPNHYIRHQNFKVFLQKMDRNKALYNADTSFDFVEPLSK